MSTCIIRPQSISALCLSAVFIFICSVNQAQALDISQVYDLAVTNDPAFQGSRHENLAEKQSVNQAKAKLFPKILAEGNLSETTQDIVSSDNTVFSEGETEFDSKGYTLTISQPVIDYSSIVGFKMAKTGLKISDLELELARQELILRVAESYFSVLAAKDKSGYSEAEVLAAERQHEYASIRKKRGLVPATDLYDANARLAFVMAESIEINDILNDKIEAIQEISGDPVGDVSTLQAEIPLVSPDPTDVEDWVATAMEQNLAIKITRMQLEIAEKEIKLQRSGHYPTLNLVGKYNRNETDGTLFGGGSEVETREIALQFRVPIFEGGATSARTKQAVEFRQIAWQNLTKESRAVIREVRSAYSGVNSSISRVNALQKSVESQDLVLEAKEKGFRSGLYTSLAVLDAARDLYFAKQEYAKARYDYILNSLRLRFAVGTLNDADLKEINGWLN